MFFVVFNYLCSPLELFQRHFGEFYQCRRSKSRGDKPCAPLLFWEKSNSVRLHFAGTASLGYFTKDKNRQKNKTVTTKNKRTSSWIINSTCWPRGKTSLRIRYRRSSDGPDTPSCFFAQDWCTKCFTGALILQFHARYIDIHQVASLIGYGMCKALPEMLAFIGCVWFRQCFRWNWHLRLFKLPRPI